MSAALFCEVCGAPCRAQLKQGSYKMAGHRGGNLCVCWEQVRGLCADDDLVQGIPQTHYGRFLDFAVMWICGYPRSVVFLELEAAGVAACM